jgi:hypothetical protein
VLPGITPRGQQKIVQPAAFLKLLVEEALLLFGWVQTVLERLEHVANILLRYTCCQA